MSDEFSADVAVVVGIAAYDPALGVLETPVRDAKAVAKLLASRFGYEVILLCDRTATLAGLRTLLLENLPQRVREGSRLLFYFAGHGVAEDSAELEGPRGFLVPQDATPAVTSHLPMEEVREALARLPCRHLLVVLDCCFSGSFHWAGRRPVHVPGELLYEERYRHWVRHPARWVLASAAHDEYALDIADRRRGQVGCHSPFATALLDGLHGEADRFPEGGDGIITLAELYAYVRDRLTPHQSPVLAPLKGHTRGEYVFRNPHKSLTLQSAEIAVELKPELNPYRGLEPYRCEDAERFFGRGDATRLLRSWVEMHFWTVVVGPSGSGKSSLIHAGLLPVLHSDPDQSWVTPTPMRVAGDPFAALRETLAAVGGPVPAGEEGLRDPPQAEVWAAAWTAAHPSARLLLVVDQAEELATRVPRSGSEKALESLPKEAAGFLACLAALIRGSDDRVRIVVAVRSDYETDLQDAPHSSLWKDGRFIVPPLRREDLREIIEGPAASRALYFDDPRLVDRLVDEVWGMPGSLPLLSYALSRLFLAYVKESRGDRLLTAHDLEAIGGESSGAGDGHVAMGGIVRILRDGADKAVEDLPDDDHRRTLWRVLLRMVHVVGTRTTRRQVPADELRFPTEAENRRVDTVCERFVNDARLLVSSQDGGCDLIEPAHDELLVAWPELVRRIDDARVSLTIHRRLTEAATEWSVETAPNSRRRKRYLDLRLLSLVETSGPPEDWLNKIEADYIAAARRARWLRTALAWSLAAATLLAAIGLALFFRGQSQRNERLRYQAIIQNLVNQAEADLESEVRTRPLLLTLQAFRLMPKSEGDMTSRVDRLLRRILEDLPPNRAVLRDIGWDAPIAFHPSGRLLVSGFKENLVFITLPLAGIVPTGTVTLSSTLRGESLQKVAFTSDGRFMAAGFDRGSLCIWQFAGSPPAPMPGVTGCTRSASGRGAVTGLAFRPGFAVLAVGRKNSEETGSLEVWEVKGAPSGAQRLELRSERPLPGAVSSVVVSAAGEMFVSVNRSLQVLHEDSVQVLRGRIDNLSMPLQRLSLSPRDPFPRRKSFMDTGDDFFARRIRTVENLRLASSNILVGSAGRKDLLWDLSSGAAPVLVESQTAVEVLARLCDYSLEVEVDPSSARAASACDGVVRLWDFRPLMEHWNRGFGRESTNPISFLGSDVRASGFAAEVPMPTALTARPDSPSTLAIGLDTGDVVLYDLATRKWSKQSRPSTGGFSEISSDKLDRDTHRVSSLVLSPDGGYHVLAADGLWWRVRERGSDPRQRQLGGHFCAAAGSTDGAWLATLSQGTSRQILLEVWSTSGHGYPVLRYSKSNDGSSCRAGMAFHPTRTELAVGIGTEITVWSPATKERWESRQLAEFDGRINALAWSGNLLAVGGDGFGDFDGSIELLLARTGELQHSWAIPGGFLVNSLVFDSEGRRLAAGTDTGGLHVWNLEVLDNPPLVLGQESEAAQFPTFLEHNQIAALTDDLVTVWNLSAERLAEAACSTAPRNLSWRDWIAFVERDLGRYLPACPALDPDPSLLTHADLLAEKGDAAEARRLYRRLNELKPGTVVDPARRAYQPVVKVLG